MVLLHRASLSSSFLTLCCSWGLPWPSLEDLALSFAVLHVVHSVLFLQSVKIPLDDTFPLAYQLHHSAWFYPNTCWDCTQSHCVVNKDTDQHQSQYRPQRDSIFYCSSFWHWNLNQNFLDAVIEPTSYPSKNPPIKPTFLHFKDRDAISVLAGVKVDVISCYSLIYQSSQTM